MIMQLKPKEYRLQVYKRTCYIFRYSSKGITETAETKIKIDVTKIDGKNFFWLLQMLTWC